MKQLILLLADITLLMAAVVVLRAGEVHRQRVSLVAYKLQFPRGLETAGVESFLGGLSGLLLPWWRRWIGSPYVSLEVHADVSGIHHYLFAPDAWAAAIEGVLQAALPSVRYEPTALMPAAVTMATEYRLNTHERSLSSYAAGMNAKLLATLQPLRKGETIVVQLLLRHMVWCNRLRLPTPGRRNVLAVQDQGVVVRDAEAVTALKNKQSQPLLLAVPRIGVTSKDKARARTLLRHTQTAWHEGRAPGVHLSREHGVEGTVARHLGNVGLRSLPGQRRSTPRKRPV